ncbi:ADP-ribosyltransferase [Streptomyces sp. CAU 1734]|uniref:ADP-ribosyltransferase n=1 Tax=Streptomyces sp. CAU 1734 TaxID=3140360 RepID=UPI003261BB21
MSSQPAMRSARRAASAQLGKAVAEAGDTDARAAYANAQAWAAHTRGALEAGDDDRARMYADNAKKCAAAARSYTRGKQPREPYPDAGDPAAPNTAPPPPPPEQARAAHALAGAAGIGGRARVMPPREDGGQTAAWNDKDFGGAATVYPGEGDEPPHARVVFTRLDQDRYDALANSPWPYRTEDGQVIYDRVPADHAEQIIHAAASRREAKPWERHGLSDAPHRAALDSVEADRLVPESRQWVSDLDDEQRDWIRTYTGDAYGEINEHLYTGRDLDQPAEDMSTPMRVVTGNIDSAIAAAGESQDPHRCYRGFTPPMEVRRENRVSSWVRENFVVGGRYRDDSYMSLSHCPKVASGFADRSWHGDGEKGKADHAVVFETVSRRGAAVAHLSEYDNDERERLMPRGSEFVVVGVQENVDVAGKPCMVVQLVDVKDTLRY